MKNFWKFLTLAFNNERGNVDPGSNPPPADPPPENNSILNTPQNETPPANEPPAPTIIEEGWLKGVSTEFGQDKVMENIKDMNSLVKGYVHAQKMVGGEKVTKPREGATAEEIRNYHHQLGLPHDINDYSVKIGEDAYVNEEFVEEFRAKAYELGVMPDQANELLGFYDSKLSGINKQSDEEYDAEVDASLKSLKEEYGQAFDQKMFKTKTFMDEFADDEMATYFEESGFNNDRQFIRLMAKIADKFVSEDNFNTNTKYNGTLSPEEANNKINEVWADPNHAYHDKNSPAHEHAVKEMNKWFEFIG